MKSLTSSNADIKSLLLSSKISFGTIGGFNGMQKSGSS